MNKEAVVEGAAVGVAAGLRQRKGEPTEDVEAGDDPDAPFEIERIFEDYKARFGYAADETLELVSAKDKSK